MFLSLFLLALAQVSQTSATIINCNASSVFQVARLTLVPDPPVIGESVAMQLMFKNPGLPVENGTVISKTTLNYLPFPTSVTDLCDMTACPIPTGFNDRSTKTVWPATVSGRITTKLVWMQGADMLVCIHTDFTVAGASLWQTFVNNVQMSIGRLLGNLNETMKT